MPRYGRNGTLYDIFSSSVKFGNRRVPITYIEVPLPGSDITSFNSTYDNHRDVTTSEGLRTNIYFRVVCEDCASARIAFIMQVMPGDTEFILDFLDGE